MKQNLGSAYDKSKEALGGVANSVMDYQPFNADNKFKGALGGAGIGALLGAGANGVRHILGGTGENSTLLGSLMNGGLLGAGLGAGAGSLASIFGPSIGGHLGARKLYNTSGVGDMPDNHFPTPGAKASIGDAIKKLGYGAGTGISQELKIRDIASAIQNGGLDYNDLGNRMMNRRLHKTMGLNGK